MFKSVVYQGNSPLGEVEIFPQNQEIDMTNKEFRISHFSQPSERCPPLAVLHTIAPCGVCLKMESKSQSGDSPLFSLHSSCLRENKTAVVPLGEEELHLVAMPTRKIGEQCLCFWGFNVAPGLYNSCLVMLNLRCLGIVFDLDETLVVANTMRSFEDRIDALQRKISTEVDPQRIAGMIAEVKRYQDDKIILKQYAENDQVIDNGKVIKVQSEIVPALSDNHQPIVRPLIRLQERNIILTRINPGIRDTSVLVRLRPAWEDLRSYLTARGRKRFEVYVCTMAERDYALEMWRLLDPDSNLINTKELLDRIVCVKAGSRKSLLNVFQVGICHPKMALVIDDRLKVWDEKDQPRVHVVPAFAPYYAPQAEANNAVPVLCVARNVACNVRGGFFKEFDEVLLQRIPEIFYEDDMAGFPSPPDVSNYLISEDDTSASNGNKDPLCFEGITDVEVERRLKDAIPASSLVNSLDPRLPLIQHAVASSSSSVSLPTSQGPMMPFPNKQFPHVATLAKPLVQVGPPELSLQSSPAREEGEVPESELDPDTRRRLLILQHGQDTREHTSSEPPFPVRPPLQVSVPAVQSHGSWFPSEEEMSPRQLNRTIPKEFPLEPEAVHFDKHRPRRPPFFQGLESSIPSDRSLNENQRLAKEVHQTDDRMRINHSVSGHRPLSGEELPLGRSSSSNRDLQFESGRGNLQYPETPAGVVQEIAMKCGTKVEFRHGLVASTELQFSFEVYFMGEKVGEGIGRTRKEAQHQAAENSIRNLANKYLSHIKSDPNSSHGDGNKLSHGNENGLLNDTNSFGSLPFSKEDSLSLSTSSESSRFVETRLEGSKKSVGSLSALKELCTVEGLNLAFQMPPISANSTQKGEIYAEVEVAGHVLGKGIGSSWDEAKIQAADEALGNLKLMLSQNTQKRPGSPRWGTSTCC
uniref:protein-serine/threonine phosphatase n=1 Tax=Nelumbo nucifera TaxID=4432 RepID=A0A822XPA0_NELNU|nr:TPA_asm: hypothetical protein HUJ06_022352 [Nelumbo nucifera]